jgi:hypothetical protein
MTRACLDELLIEQLVEGEATPAQLRFLEPFGTMHELERAAQLDELVGLPELWWMRIVDEGEQLVEVLMHQDPNLAMREALRRGIHGQYPSRVAGLFSLIGEHDEFLRDDLLAVVVAHRAGDEQQLAFLDLALEKWPARPRAFEQPALVLEHRAENAEAAPGRQDAGAHDATDARDVLAHHRARERRHGGCVEIAMWRVVQQVADGADAESLQRFGALRADAFEKLDRRIELKAGRQSLTS